MFESFMTFVPVEWRGAFALLSAPIAWVPSWHLAIVDFAWHGEGVAAMLSKRGLLAPAGPLARGRRMVDHGIAVHASVPVAPGGAS